MHWAETRLLRSHTQTHTVICSVCMKTKLPAPGDACRAVQAFTVSWTGPSLRPRCSACSCSPKAVPVRSREKSEGWKAFTEQATGKRRFGFTGWPQSGLQGAQRSGAFISAAHPGRRAEAALKKVRALLLTGVHPTVLLPT